MKKIISLLAIVCLICCMFPISVFASSDTEYIRNDVHTGIWYSNPATKDALDSCAFLFNVTQGTFLSNLTIDLRHSTVDIYDDLLLTGIQYTKTQKCTQYIFQNGTIRCNDCRALNLYEDDILLELFDVTIENGRAICPEDNNYGYGGAIYFDGADCKIFGNYNPTPNSGMKGVPVEIQTHCYIKNCYTSYGGAIAVCGHDCKIENIIFQSNTGINNGGNDLYVYWGDCKVSSCTFDKDQEGAAAYITADTYFTGCNITKDMCVGDLHQVFITNPTASLISEGNLGIIIALSVLALGGIVAVIIVNKKKKIISNEK